MQTFSVSIPNLGVLRGFTDDDGRQWIRVADLFKAAGFNGSSLLANRPLWRRHIKRFYGEMASYSTVGVNYIEAEHVLEVLSHEKRNAPALISYLQMCHTDLFGTLAPTVTLTAKPTDTPPQDFYTRYCELVDKMIALCDEYKPAGQQTLFKEEQHETQSPQPNN